MNDERTEERDLPPSDPSAANPQPAPQEKPRSTSFENEWDDAPTTNTFRIPRL